MNQCLFKHINAGRDSKNTMIDVFATLFLLSYAKLCFISIGTALYPVFAWSTNNFLVHSRRSLFSDPTIKYHSAEYLTSEISSSIINQSVLLLPIILLALYPIRAIRSLLFKSHFISRHMGAINMFLDKFYSCYKDGLDGGRDMRSFASLYFFVYWFIFASVIVQ